MFSNLVFILISCCVFFTVKGHHELENWRIKVDEGNNGTCSRKFKVETLQEICKDFPPCIPGEKGVAGPVGERGEKGEKGSKGARGECKPQGTKENPAASCDVGLDDTWIFKPKPFQVSCKDKPEMCIDIPKSELKAEDKDEQSTIIKKQDWLWPAINRTAFKDFYGYEKSQISHLISITDDVFMDLIVHCYNFVLKNNVQVLLWDNSLVGQNTTPTTPVTYTVPEELNGCKNISHNEWGSAIISLKTWSTAVQNFFVTPAKTPDEQKIYIQLKKLCFSF